MKKNDVVVKVNPTNRQVYFNDNFLGLNAENLQSNLVFEFDGEFVSGTPRVEVEKDENKYIITEVSKVNDTYVMEIKSSLLNTINPIYMQLVVTEVGDEEIPIFKSKQFYLIVGESINASTELPDEYQTLYDQIEEKIAEVDNLNISAERVSDGVEIDITDKTGTTTTTKVNDGEKGDKGDTGATGITPNIHIGTIESGESPSVTRTGTNEDPYLNFVLVKGDTGETGATGNGISNITKTSTSGLVDTYTINYTNGNSTTYNVTNGEDGDDYVITQQDYQNIANVVEIDISSTLNAKQNISDNTLETNNKTVPNAINEVNSIAKGANQAISKTNYQTMITEFNSLDDDVYNVGQNIYIETLEVPDLWIISVEETSVPYTYTTDSAFIAHTAQAGGGQVGYYKIAQLETQKVDLTNYVEFTDYASQNTGGVAKMWTSYNADNELGLNISTQ